MMSWEIIFVFILMGFSIISFISEKISPDLTALIVMGVLTTASVLNPTSLLLPDVNTLLSVFSHPAPLTIAGMFIVSTALEKTGVIQKITFQLERLTRLSYNKFIFILVLIVAAASAFINNTPVVIVLMPVVLSLAKSMNISASKLLIPLSYASILGGTCTLIGTSTNLIASGILVKENYAPIGMFELSAIGLPLILSGGIYLIFFGNKLLPKRETLTAILSEEERKEFITEVYIKKHSKFIGFSYTDSGLINYKSFRLIEIIRNGVVLKGDIKNHILKDGDRLLLSCRPLNNLKDFELPNELKENLALISSSVGRVIEGIVAPNSKIIGKTLEEINFRQQFRTVLIAIHRKGINLRKSLNMVRLQEGDTLLLMGSLNAIENLNNSEQIIILDNVKTTKKKRTKKQPIALLIVTSIVVLASVGIDIVALVISGVAILLLTKCIKPNEAYESVEWSILVIIFGMLSLGQAMISTGASELIASNIINLVPSSITNEKIQLYIFLAIIYIITSIFTEFLSNNAAVALMVPIAIGLAVKLGLDPRPFVIATCIAGSASFSTPIGYQTNTYVYSAGGYKFTDFTKFGLPLNIICFLVSILLIPIFWEFKNL